MNYRECLFLDRLVESTYDRRRTASIRVSFVTTLCFDQIKSLSLTADGRRLVMSWPRALSVLAKTHHKVCSTGHAVLNVVVPQMVLLFDLFYVTIECHESALCKMKFQQMNTKICRYVYSCGLSDVRVYKFVDF